MCWSKHEREQWERERREAELEAERIRLVSTAEPAEKLEPVAEGDEREPELVRGGGRCTASLLPGGGRVAQRCLHQSAGRERIVASATEEALWPESRSRT
jgi:hypothetical protein